MLTGSRSIVYTVVGSTLNLKFKDKSPVIMYRSNRNGHYSDYFLIPDAIKYDIVFRPSIIELQIKNVTTNNTGLYWIEHLDLAPKHLQLSITNMSCPSRATKEVCAKEGSSALLTFIIEDFIYHSPTKDLIYYNQIGDAFRSLGNFTLHVDFYIYNVTHEDEGFYRFPYIFNCIGLQVSKLWFINQTELKAIVGQEGETLHIICSSDPDRYITELTLKSNGTVKAIGDNHTVSFSFIPDRTDHRRKFQCVDSNHSSIMVEVELSIRYAPAVIVRYTNGTIECDCDGVPPVYSVYRLDRISKYGELVRSIYLDNRAFIFKTDEFPYQRNGRYMCVVSNGIPDTNGKKLQNSSTHVNYTGPPVFAKENRYVKIGKMRESSVTISFYVYSCPDVEEIFLEKLGRLRGQKKKIDEYVLKPTLLNNEFDKTTGVPGYDIVIKSDELYINDVQPYCITVTNRLGASEYHFAVTKKEHNEINQKERTYVFTICILGVVLFCSTIVYVGVCVRRVRLRVPIQSNVNEDHTYHTYDEIGTISYGAVSNVRPSDTNDNPGQHLTHLIAAHISNEVNRQSTDDNSTELIADFPNDDLPQHEVIEVQKQHIPISTDDIDSIDNKEQTSPRNSQTSIDPDSESSQTVMVGNVGDGYEHPYQIVLQDHQESNQYNQITREGNNSILSNANLQSTDVNTTELNANFPENSLKQCEVTELQVQHTTKSIHDVDFTCTDLTLTSCTVIPNMQNIVHRIHIEESTNNASSGEKSQHSNDSDSGSSNNVMVDYYGDGYENLYQMVIQDPAGSYPYTEIIRERQSASSSTDNDEKEEQGVQQGSAKKREYINLQF
ncbi:Hypothetical predicted protein [Mytilus galloprovincialis]|uniref:Ig-like domain-containing protein n=1 Tax=Mytilus galloprovincialis TaxID=29158 RepID=A0A8B6FA11_MYTGA|nr:Hypothetical predicted protein [Mytilus galloprovincialis]